MRAADRAEFAEGSVTHDTACMAVIRLKSLTEVPDFAEHVRVLDAEQLAGLSRLRNIASRGGYLAMNDDVLWDVVTRRLQPLIDAIEASVRGVG